MTTIVVDLEDKPGVLNRVTSLCWRRAFNIEWLSFNRTALPRVARMTMVIDTDERGAQRLEDNLYKIINVIHVNVTTWGAAKDESVVDYAEAANA